MMKKCKDLDTSNELLVQSWLNGVKLVHPNKLVNSSHTINNLFKLPINVFFSLADSTIFKLNERTASICGFDSAHSAVGRTILDVATKESFEFERKHDMDVMNSKQLKIRDELYVSLEDISVSAISFKLPWYNADNKIIGIFGCAIVMNESHDYSLAESIASILQTNLFRNLSTTNSHEKRIPGREINNCYLTKRQMECAQLLVRGKTTKEIASILNLSKRTIEHYIENMKIRLNVQSKSKLIDILLGYFQ